MTKYALLSDAVDLSSIPRERMSTKRYGLWSQVDVGNIIFTLTNLWSLAFLKIKCCVY